MASALITYERKAILSRNTAMKKAQKTANDYALDLGVTDQSTAPEIVAESDGHRADLTVGSQSLAISLEPPSETASEDSCSLKRKSMSLNANGSKNTLKSIGILNGSSSTNLTRVERRQVRKRLKLELEQLRSVCLKLEAREEQLKSLLQPEAPQQRAAVSTVEGNGFLPKLPVGPLTPTVDVLNRQARLPRQPSLIIPDTNQETPGAACKDKRTPKANQLYVNSEFVSGKDKLPASEKSKSKAGIQSKRNILEKSDSRDSKRQRAETSQGKKIVDLLKQCGVILKKLMTHKHGWIFNEPVDVVKWGLHDYFKIIRKPMDFGTIKKNLDSSAYSQPADFAEDVRLTFSNAMKYNPQGHEVYCMADTLKAIFEDKWSIVEAKLKDLFTGEGLTARDSKESVIVNSSLIQVEDLHQEQQANVRPSGARKSKPTTQASLSAKVNTKAASLPKRNMTFGEKQTLSKDLESLAEDKLERIYQIIKNKDPNLTQTDEGIEVDIDAFDSQTLWELHRFVVECKKGKGKSKKPMEKALPVDNKGASRSQMPNGVSSIPKASVKGGEGGEEDVDIGDDVPSGVYPPVVIDKDGGFGTKNSSSSSSSSGSGSSSSDSDSGSSSASESDGDALQSAGAVSKVSQVDKEPVGSGAVGDQRGSPALEVDGAKMSVSDLDEESAAVKTQVLVLDAQLKEEGNVPDMELSPERRLRAAILRNRFADTIFKAQQKNLPLNKSNKTDPAKLKKEQEELEQRQKEEKARLQAEARAAEQARKTVEAEAAAEARRRREAEREAARLALQNMEKTVEIDENSEVLKDLERLKAMHSENLSSSGDETSPMHSSDGLPAFALQVGGNPLEQLGLFMKDDEDDEEHGPEPGCNQVDTSPGDEDEEGEIED